MNTNTVQTVRFFVGIGYDKNNQPVLKAGEKIRECAEYLSNLFGGVTVLDAHGYWKNENQLVREPSIDFEVVTDKEHFLMDAAETLKKVFNQSAVLMTRQPVEMQMV